MHLHSGPVSAGFPDLLFRGKDYSGGTVPDLHGIPFSRPAHPGDRHATLGLLFLFFLLVYLWAG